VTALSGIAQHVDATWIASALSQEDKTWQAIFHHDILLLLTRGEAV
jgi:hypothetical protein